MGSAGFVCTAVRPMMVRRARLVHYFPKKSNLKRKKKRFMLVIPRFCGLGLVFWRGDGSSGKIQYSEGTTVKWRDGLFHISRNYDLAFMTFLSILLFHNVPVSHGSSMCYQYIYSFFTFPLCKCRSNSNTHRRARFGEDIRAHTFNNCPVCLPLNG